MKRLPCRYCQSPRTLDALAGHERRCPMRRTFCATCQMQHAGALRFRRHDAYPGHVATVAPQEGISAQAVFSAMRELASERRAS